MLQAAAVGSGGTATNVLAKPLEFDVLPAAPLPSFKVVGGARFEPGMRLTKNDGAAETVLSVSPETWTAQHGIKPGDAIRLVGFLSVDRDGEYQFHLKHGMKLALVVDDRPTFQTENAEYAVDYVPVALKAGLHKVEISATVTGDTRLDLRFGYSGPKRLKPAAMSFIP
jgi:hypothetical protein